MRKAGADALRMEDSAALVGGEAGMTAVLPTLDNEEMEEWRGTVERLERKLCPTISTSGDATGDVTAEAPTAFLVGVLRDRKAVGKVM